MIPVGRIEHTNRWTHPEWCDPRLCVIDNDDVNIEHKQLVARWKATSDTTVTLLFAELDEVFEGKQLRYEPTVGIRLDEMYGDDETVTAHLGGNQCRELARHLLELADKLDDGTPIAAIPKQQNRIAGKVKLAAAPTSQDGGDAA